MKDYITVTLSLLILSGCYTAEDDIFCQDISKDISVCKQEREWAREHKEHKKKNSAIEDCENNWRNEREAGYDEDKLHKMCEEKTKRNK